MRYTLLLSLLLFLGTLSNTYSQELGAMTISALQWENYIDEEEIKSFQEKIKREDKIELTFKLENVTKESQA